MPSLFQLHREEQCEAFERDKADFEHDWQRWPERLSGCGMDCLAIETLKLRCWLRFLEGRGIGVDGGTPRG